MANDGRGQRGPHELLGRHSECAELETLLDRARGGRSGVLVLRGEPGIGKTALLQYLVGAASEFNIARAGSTSRSRRALSVDRKPVPAARVDALLPVERSTAIRPARTDVPGFR